MKNKIGKLFVFAILGFLASTISVHALSYDVTDPSSFNAIINKYNETTQSVYVIGSYVFTTDHKINTQDMMLSALSIDLGDTEEERIKDSAAYKKMTVFKLEREYDSNDRPTGKWKVAKNFVGTDTLKDGKMVDISYIDYEKIQGDSSLSVTFEASETMVTDLKKWGYDVVLDNQEGITAVADKNDPTKIKLDGKVYHVPTIKNWAQEKQTGYYIAFEVIIPEEYKDKAQWWLSEDNKLTHDGMNYAVVGLTKEAEDKTFEVWVDFDGDGEEYEPACYTFDYSDIEFGQKLSNATISATTTDEKVKGVYQSALNIHDGDFVTIDENNNVTGNIHYNPDVTVLPEDKTDYYIPVIVTIDKAFANTATFTTVNGDRTKTGTFEENADSEDKTILALLFAVKDENADKTFTITIDLDGEETAYEPKDYVFDYSEAVFLAKPESSVSAEGKEDNKEEYANVMKPFGFEGNPDTLKVNIAGDNVTLTGQLVNEKYDFNGTGTANVEGYYFQYVIEISGDATHSSITIPVGPDKTQTFKYEQFDFKDKNGVSGIVVLHKLNPDSDTKKFNVTVDYDGDGKEDKTYQFDYNNLDLDKNSEVVVATGSNKVSDGDKSTLNTWGFTDEALNLTTIEGNVISGTIPYIDNISEEAFSSEADRTGNYMVYTIEIPTENRDKAQIKLSCTNGNNCKDGWKIINAEKNSDTSILHSVKQNEDGSLKDIVAYVDLDGFENNPEESEVVAMAIEADEPIYLPYEIRLTFDESIVVQKKSNATVKEVTNESNPGLKNWMSSHKNIPTFSFDNYNVTQKDDKITITGKANAQKKSDGTLEWYVAYKFVFDKKYDGIEIKKSDNTIIKQGDSAWDGGTDGKEITFVTQLTDTSQKTTTFTIDLDGKEGNQYAPVEYTVDYSSVTLLSNGVSFVKLTDEKKSGFENWMQRKGFDSFKLSDFVVTQDGTNVAIEGEVQKQTHRGDDGEQYWIAYLLKLDKKYEKIKITKPDGSVIQINTPDTWDGGSDNTQITFTTNVTDSINQEHKPFTFKVDFDGDGNLYEEVPYTIDWTKVTAREG